MKLTDDQQRRIPRHIESVKSVRRIFAWLLFILSTVGLGIYINISFLPLMTQFWQEVFFELGVIMVVGFVNFICLCINYKPNDAAVVVAVVAAVVAVAAVAVAVVAVAAAAVAVAVLVVILVPVIAAVAATDGLVERD